MADQELYERIEAYLNGDLRSEDLADFERQMESDANLASQVAMFRGLDEAISDKPVLNFQKLVEDQGATFLKSQKQTPIKRLTWRRGLAIAASFLLLASAVFIWKSQMKPDLNNQEIFAQHFEIYELNESLRSGEDIDSKFDDAIQKYQAGEYEESAALFEQLVNADQSNMLYSFCLAQANINLKPRSLDNANLQFEKVIAEGNSIYVPASKWYLALIALAQEDPTTTRKLIKEIESGGGNWSIGAKNLSTQLNR